VNRIIDGVSGSIGACGKGSAFDQAFRYRDMMFRGLHDRGDFLAIHQALMEDVLSRDPARAIPALRAHLALTPRMVYGAQT